MKRNLASIVAAASLFVSTPAFADELKEGDKMPEPRGRYVLVGMGETLKIKDNLAMRQYISGNIPSPYFNFLLKPYLKKENNLKNPFDFEILVLIEGTNNIYKRIVLLSDENEKDRYVLYQDCSPDGLIDSVKKMEEFDYDSVRKLNVEELSCRIITLTDFPIKNKSKQNLVTILNSEKK